MSLVRSRGPFTEEMNPSAIETDVVRHLAVEPEDITSNNSIHASRDFPVPHSLDSVHLQSKLFTCNFCLESFTEKNLFNRHIAQVHTDEWTFECMISEKKFAYQCRLDWHLLSHNTERSFVCTQCGESE